MDGAAAKHPQARVHADRPLDAFPDDPASLSYPELVDMGRRLSAGLHAAGVRSGERVAVVKSNHLDVYLLAYAAMRIGAIPAMLSPELEPAVARRLLDDLGNPPLVTDPAVAGHKALRGVDLREASRLPLAVGGSVHGAVEVDLDAPAVDAAVDRRPDVEALITHTSGTTGIPKLAQQTHRTLAANWSMVSAWARVLRVQETIGAYLAFPHIRVVTGVTQLLLMGWPLVVLTDPAPAHVDAVFSEHRPGVIETFPNTYILWERLLESPTRPLSSARFYLNTFDAMHPSTLQAVLEGSSRRGATYIQLYGQSETGPVTARFYPRRAARHAHGRCVGYPLVGFSRYKIAPSGDPSRPGGEVLAKSKSLVSGYVGRQEQYDANFVDGWWRMTDMGYRSRWGCLHLQDRVIDQTPAAESLLALEDRLIGRLEDVVEAVLIPLEDGSVAPVVCTRDDVPLDMAAWGAATADMPMMAAPRHIPWADLPKTGTWKVRRVETRRLIAEGRLGSSAA